MQNAQLPQFTPEQQRGYLAARYIQFTNCPPESPYPNQTPFTDLAQHLQIPISECRSVLGNLVQRRIALMHPVKGKAEKEYFEAYLKQAFAWGLLLTEEQCGRLGLVWGQDETTARVNGYLVALLYYRLRVNDNQALQKLLSAPAQA